MSSNSPNSGGGGRQKKQDHQTAAVSSPVAQADADTARKIHSNGTSTKTNNSNANKQKPQKSAGGGGGKKKGGKNANNKATGTGAGGADTPGASDKKKKTPPSAKPNQSGTKGGKGKTPPPPPSAAVSNGKQQQEEVMIHMDGEAADSVNYAVLKRIEPTLKGIIARASFSVIYVYSQESESWKRKNIEGACFVVERETAPHCRFLVVNRLSPTNFLQDISFSVTFQSQGHYLFFKDRSIGATHCVWFYDTEELQAIVETLKRLKESEIVPTAEALGKTEVAEHRSPPAKANNTRATTNEAGANILSLISGPSPQTDNNLSESSRTALATDFDNSGSTPAKQVYFKGGLHENDRDHFRKVFKEMLEDDTFVDMLIEKFYKVSTRFE